VVGLALLADTVGKDTAAQSFGYIGAASSLGTLIGPVVGGAVYQSAGYYTVFGMCFAFVGLDIILRLSIIEKKAALKWATPAKDLQKDLDDAFGLGPKERNSIKGAPPSIGRDTKSTDTDVEVASIVGSEFTLEQKKGGMRVPAMLKLLKSPRVLAAFFGDFVIATIMVAFDTTLVVYVSDTFHWSAPQAGLSFVPLLFPSFLGPVFGNMVDKYGARLITAIGLFAMVPPLIFLRTATQNTPEQIALLCVLLSLVGLGEAMATTGLYTEYSKVCDAMEAAEPGSLGSGGGYAQSYGVSEIAWALAGLISPFLAGGIFDSAGWGTLGSSLSVFCILASIPVLLFTNR
jgi:MFS family permease